MIGREKSLGERIVSNQLVNIIKIHIEKRRINSHQLSGECPTLKPKWLSLPYHSSQTPCKIDHSCLLSLKEGPDKDSISLWSRCDEVCAQRE